MLWATWDGLVAGDPLLAVNRTDQLAEIARKLTPLREAPKVMTRMIMAIDEPALFFVAAAGMAAVLIVALRSRRLPADPLPFLVVTVIPLVLLAEIARDYPLRVRYVLPVAVVIAIEAAVALVAAGALPAAAASPGLRPWLACAGYGVVAGYGVRLHGQPRAAGAHAGAAVRERRRPDARHVRSSPARRSASWPGACAT